VAIAKRKIEHHRPVDQDRGEIVRKLVDNANQLLALARSLDPDGALAGAASAPESEFVPAIPLADHGALPWGQLAGQSYRERRARDRIFADKSLFGEPAWDMLLDLMASEMSGRKLSVTSACIGACVPSTTALRWLSLLEERGLVLRENDTRDGRRAFVRISPDGFRKMVGYFDAVERGRVD